jgi:hypothetical protein
VLSRNGACVSGEKRTPALPQILTSSIFEVFPYSVYLLEIKTNILSSLKTILCSIKNPHSQLW